MSERTAAAAHIQVGDTVELSADPALGSARRARVTGILPVKADPVDIGRGTLWVKLHLPDMAALTERADDVDEVILKARRPQDAARLRDRLNSLSAGYRAYTSQELAERTSQTFEVIRLFHQAISIITLFAGAVFLLAILLFKVEERRREIGALRLMGVRRRSVLVMLSAEALGIALLGSVLGVGLGRVAAALVNAHYQAFYHTTLTFAAVTPAVAISSLVLGVGFGFGAGVLVAILVLRTPPLRLMGR